MLSDDQHIETNEGECNNKNLYNANNYKIGGLIKDGILKDEKE